ncbi:hypothetical protein EDC01DRAFT_742703 [Geopyxis carbonaria]|nr:hypothetical protein EDC01DRAFT_742703 [Geopyxis carbonaria]
MPRVVRRQSTTQRVISMLNPFDHLLQWSTEFDAIDWDSIQDSYGKPIGIALNVLCAFSRSATGGPSRYPSDDVFARPVGRSNWSSGFAYITWTVSWGLALFSIVNMVYCFSNKRRYRLFEHDIMVEPPTPSVRRVRVDSSPTSNSPMRIFGNIKAAFTDDPSSRSHPDSSRDVWELSVWNPPPISMSIYTLFSPAHVAVYFLSFPLNSSAQYTNSPLTGTPPGINPSGVIFTVLATQALISIHLAYTAASYKQQAYDQRLLSKQVMSEYDSKYVHPRLDVRTRDVGVQTANAETGTPSSTVCFSPELRRTGFKINPNPNYAALTMQGGRGEEATNSVQRFPGIPRETSYDSPTMGKLRQPQFERLGAPRRATSTSTDTDMQNGSDESEYSSSQLTERTPSRRATGQNYTPNRPNPATTGIIGLVNFHVEQNRHLSPTKMSTPLGRSGRSGVRPSTYAASLNTPLGTPVRRNRNAF